MGERTDAEAGVIGGLYTVRTDGCTGLVIVVYANVSSSVFVAVGSMS